MPDDIARLVEKALTADNPAPRYSGPLHAKFFLFLKWARPDGPLAYRMRLNQGPVWWFVSYCRSLFTGDSRFPPVDNVRHRL